MSYKQIHVSHDCVARCFQYKIVELVTSLDSLAAVVGFALFGSSDNKLVMLVDNNRDKLDTGSYTVVFVDYSYSKLLHFNPNCSCFNKVLDIQMQEAHRNNALYNDRHSIARTIVQDKLQQAQRTRVNSMPGESVRLGPDEAG